MQQELEVNIDFDGAIEAWNANKRRVGQGYVYICATIMKNGKKCQRKPKERCEKCYQHQREPRFPLDPSLYLIN
jgi:hypothetical protein